MPLHTAYTCEIGHDINRLTGPVTGLQIEKTMKALFVRKLYLWPRFEAHVKEALNDLPIEVGPTRPVMFFVTRTAVPCPVFFCGWYHVCN